MSCFTNMGSVIGRVMEQKTVTEYGNKIGMFNVRFMMVHHECINLPWWCI